MSEYNNPRPLPNASASDPCTIVDNAISFDKVVNGNSTVTTYTGKQIISLSQAIDKFGFGVAPFTFTTGGILESKNLLVSNDPVDGFLYKYVGSGSFPLTVKAGTNQTVCSDWQPFAATDHNLLSNRNAAGAHDAIYERAFGSIQEMIDYTGHVIGLKYSTGGTTWMVKTATPISITDFEPIGDIFALDFGYTGDIGVTLTAALSASETANVYLQAGSYEQLTELNNSVTVGGRRVYGDGRNTIINLKNNSKLFETHGDFKFNDITVALQQAQTTTVIKYDWVSGAKQSNTSDLSGITILGNNANCIAIHLKCSNNSYFAYNNWHNIAVVNEGCKKACILLEVDGSLSYIQGNTFSNLNLIRGGIRYITDRVESNVKNLKGNTFTGTYQTKTGVNEKFEYSGINIGWSWDSAGFANVSFLEDSITYTGGLTFYELNGDNRWSVSTPVISVIDGWSQYTRNYSSIATGCQTAIINSTSKAQRGRLQIIDPCFNSFDPRFTLIGASQAGVVSVRSSHSRGAVKLTNTAANADPASLSLMNTACTINKFPQFVIGMQKNIEGFYGAGTPAAWNYTCDVNVGLISQDGYNGVYVKIASAGDIQNSNVSVVYKNSGVETVVYSGMVLAQLETCYVTIVTTNLNVEVTVTKTNSSKYAGIILAENPTVGQSSGKVIIPRSLLFDNNSALLNPSIVYTYPTKTSNKGSYNVFAIEYTQTDL